MTDDNQIKLPKKGAVARLRELYRKSRKQPASPRLREILKKRPKTSEEPLRRCELEGHG